MWDYSWIKMHHAGGAFEDFEVQLRSLLDRGFNTVRIDALPLIIGALDADEDAVTFAADPSAAWGYTRQAHSHRPVSALTEFMAAAKRLGVYVVLSSWGVEAQEFPNLRRRYLDRSLFRGAWNRVLDLLGNAGLLDHVLYVDLDQEFPFFSPFGSELAAIGASDPATAALAPGHRWTAAQRGYARGLFDEMLSHFQRRYPGLRFTYSFTSFFEDVREMAYDGFDVLEVHLWSLGKRFLNRTGFAELERTREDYDYTDYQRRVDETLAAIRPMMLARMHNQLAFVREWGREIAAPVTTTEAWGPWWHMDNPTLRWDWLADWCAECVSLAADYELWGITPWNYSHPYWRNWSDPTWYRSVNEGFLRDGG